MLDASTFGQELAAMVKARIAPLLDKIADLEKRLDGLPDIGAMVQEAALEAVKAIPAPKDGRDGTDGAPGQKGADGLDVKDLFRGEGGRMIAVMSNGETKDLGEFVGKDGRDGTDGAPGQDGLGFEDMEFEEKDGRLYATFKRGDLVKTARIPGIAYHGVWKAGEYLTGDSVTFGACQWIAKHDTAEKPGEGSAWQLSVRKGRDGKDMMPKEGR